MRIKAPELQLLPIFYIIRPITHYATSNYNNKSYRRCTKKGIPFYDANKKHTSFFYEKKKPRSDIKNLEKETQLNLTDGNENWTGIPGSQVCHLKLLFSSKSHIFNELPTTQFLSCLSMSEYLRNVCRRPETATNQNKMLLSYMNRKYFFESYLETKTNLFVCIHYF